MTAYDDTGRIKIFKARNPKNNPKAPIGDGYFVAHRDIRAGERINLAIWKSESTNPGAPLYSGNIQDPHSPDEVKAAKEQVQAVASGIAGNNTPAGGFDEDDIPF